MKCSKCGYLGFETGDRCRNCGYDFSLAGTPGSSELPLHDAGGEPGPLADLFLGQPEGRGGGPPASGTLDLDRLIGAPDEPPPGDARHAEPAGTVAQAGATAMSAGADDPPAPSSADTPGGLPLFSGGRDQVPMIAAPRPVRPPLAVRRATPDVPRNRSRTTRPVARDEPLDFGGGVRPARSHPVAVPARAGARQTAPPWRAPALAPLPAAGAVPRALAAAIDFLLLAALDVAVLYFTVRILQLSFEEAHVLPAVPMAAFLLLLNGGYLVVFTIGGGQTIGKMLTGIRAIGDDGRGIDAAGAILRAAGIFASLLTAGAGYLPAFVTADRRALQDRLAGTRVVRVAASVSS